MPSGGKITTCLYTSVALGMEAAITEEKHIRTAIMRGTAAYMGPRGHVSY